MAQQIKFVSFLKQFFAWQRIKQFILNNGPLLTTITVFILVYFIGGQAISDHAKTPGVLQPVYQHRQPDDRFYWDDFCDHLKGIDLSVAGKIALTSVASAALLAKCASPCRGDSLDAVNGDCFRVGVGQYYPLSKSGAVYRDLDGDVFSRAAWPISSPLKLCRSMTQPTASWP